jgi:hypothetical protein
VSVQTRRKFLEQALFVPLATGLDTKPADIAGLEIISEPNCLSEESAAGFRSLIAAKRGCKPRSDIKNVILFCGTSKIDTPHAIGLRERATCGAWIIWECSPVCCNLQNFAKQRRILRDLFGIVLREPIPMSPDQLRKRGMYIRYRWPCEALIRTFSVVIPVACSDGEMIAHYGRMPIAIRRRIGRGGMVFLGSMLGPNIRAEELEAQVIGSEMLGALA